MGLRLNQNHMFAFDSSMHDFMEIVDCFNSILILYSILVWLVRTDKKKN